MADKPKITFYSDKDFSHEVASFTFDKQSMADDPNYTFYKVESGLWILYTETQFEDCPQAGVLEFSSRGRVSEIIGGGKFIRSMRCHAKPEKPTAIFFQDRAFEGEQLVATSDISFFGERASFADADSFIILSGTFTLYQNKDYGGESEVVAAGPGGVPYIRRSGAGFGVSGCKVDRSA